jgi:3-oxoacyl-[acyl-carrier protein] reductase
VKLNGRVALITGSGTGIGRAISELFANEGAKVALHYHHSRDGAEELASRIRSKGGTAISIACDVSRESEVRSMVDRTHAEFGRLDILVNNAGWSTIIPHHKLEELTDEIWERTLDTNLRGCFYCIRVSVPFLRQHPGTSIINVASTSGITGEGSSIVYAASKAGMLTMTKSLARALAPQIRVNAISPGLIRTHFANRQDSAPLFETEERATPLQKLATIEDCAAAALFLAADAPAITGQTILVEGGLITLGPVRSAATRTEHDA